MKENVSNGKGAQTPSTRDNLLEINHTQSSKTSIKDSERKDSERLGFPREGGCFEERISRTEFVYFKEKVSDLTWVNPAGSKSFKVLYFSVLCTYPIGSHLKVELLLCCCVFVAHKVVKPVQQNGRPQRQSFLVREL